MKEISLIREGGRLPTIAGSGVTPENAAEILAHADGAIVGVSFKDRRDDVGHHQRGSCAAPDGCRAERTAGSRVSSISLSGVSKFWGDTVGVKDLSLDIEDKEFLVLLGPSGCGKTTTMRMVAGTGETKLGNDPYR